MGIKQKGGLTFARIERKIPVLRPALQSNQLLAWSLQQQGLRDGGPDSQVASIVGRDIKIGSKTDPCKPP